MLCLLFLVCLNFHSSMGSTVISFYSLNAGKGFECVKRGSDMEMIIEEQA